MPPTQSEADAAAQRMLDELEAESCRSLTRIAPTHHEAAHRVGVPEQAYDQLEHAALSVTRVILDVRDLTFIDGAGSAAS